MLHLLISTFMVSEGGGKVDAEADARRRRGGSTRPAAQAMRRSSKARQETLAKRVALLPTKTQRQRAEPPSTMRATRAWLAGDSSYRCLPLG